VRKLLLGLLGSSMQINYNAITLALQVCTPIHTTPHGSPDAALRCWLAQQLVDCAEELCSYTVMKSQALWTAPAVCSSNSHAQRSAARGTAAASQVEELAASLSLSLLCARCLAGSIKLLAASQSTAWVGGEQQRQHDAATVSCGAGLRRCSEALLSLVEGFVTACTRLSYSKNAGAAAGMPSSGAALDVAEQAPSSGAPQQTAVDPTLLEVSTRHVECLAACLAGLAATATNPEGPSSPLPFPSLAALPSSLLPILIDLHGYGVGRPGAVQYSKWWWRAVDSLLDLLRQPVQESLGGGMAGRLLGLAISGLATGHRSALIPMLRCVR